MDLSSTSVVCREVFDENSQPSAEEISDYAKQIGIDPESESHLLPLAKDGLMQALPAPWKVYYDEKALTHYYYNEETKVTQWEHPLDNIYRDLVKKARDVSIHEDTCASVQELPTFEENPKQADVKNDSDDEGILTDSDVNSDTKDKRGLRPANIRMLAPLGRPPRAPVMKAVDKRLNDLKMSPLRKSIDGRKEGSAEALQLKLSEKPRLIKQQSQIIDLKMPVLNSPEEKSFNLFSGNFKEKGLTLTGKGEMFMKMKKADLPSPDSQKSFTQDSGTKTDNPKGILREVVAEIKKPPEVIVKSTASFEDDRKSVRFQIENAQREATMSPSSNSSSDQNEGASSIISAPPSIPPLSPLVLNPSTLMSPSVPSIPTYKANVPNYPKKLAPLPTRPSALQIEKTITSGQEVSDVPKDELEENMEQPSPSPKRRVLKPPPADYIKPDLFLKNFQKISDMVKPGDNDGSSESVEEPVPLEKVKEKRPRSPMDPPQKSKISINLMESIDSDSSLDEPDKEMENLHLEEAMEEELNRIYEIPPDDLSVENGGTGAMIFSPRLDTGKSSAQSLEESIKHANEMLSSRSSSLEGPALLNPVPKKGIPFNFKIDPKATIPETPTKPSRPGYQPLARPAQLIADAASAKVKALGSPKIDGVVISQGKGFNKDPDNVVVMLQFEAQPKADIQPLNNAEQEAIDKIRVEEKARLEALLECELEKIRSEWAVKERTMKNLTRDRVNDLENKFEEECRRTLIELSEIHHKQLGEAKRRHEQNFADRIHAIIAQNDEKFKQKSEAIDQEYEERLNRIRKEHERRIIEEKNTIIRIKLENERTLREMHDKSTAELEKEKARFLEESQMYLSKMQVEHHSKVKELKEDYRAEVDRLRNQHACHLEEIRARLASERAAAAMRSGVVEDHALAEKYRCLKEKYARLKCDVRLSLERRNKRREMSLTTGSETEKSNSNKGNQSHEKRKEANEPAVHAPIKAEHSRARPNINAMKYDNETSQSESQANNNNNHGHGWKGKQNEAMVLSPETSQASASKPPPLKVNRRSAVAFREPQKKRRERGKKRDAGASDCLDSSDATTTADEKPKTSVNGKGRRRCFTRLKSASTSRLNYSPKRGEGWNTPLEALRQQLKKLDDLEDQFPDVAGQPSYSLRYPFAEIGEVGAAETPELEFVRHRALIEREGMRRARAVLRRRKAALAETRSSTNPYPKPADDKDTTELEVALHRARALLGEKEIRLRHIERSLHRMADTHLANTKQQDEGESDSSESSVEGVVASGVVLRSLRALHADVRDIWLALDGRPTTSGSAQQRPRASVSAAEPLMRGAENAGVNERARGLRRWLHTAP